MGCACCRHIELRKEFKKEKFFLDHPHPNLFLRSEWQQNQNGISLWYLSYRWFWALWHVGWCIWAMVKEDRYFFLYLTNLTYMMMAICTLVHAVIVLLAFVYYRSTGSLPGRMGLRMKLLWVLQNIIGFPPLFITLAFWTLLYNYADNDEYLLFNIILHLLNSVYVLIDVGVSAAPFHLLHVSIPTVYMLLYVLFTLIYYLAGGTTSDGGKAIYPFLDFENLGYTLPFIAAGVILAPLCQAMVWFPYRCRVTARRVCIGRRESLAPMGTSFSNMGYSTDVQDLQQQPDKNSAHSTLHI